MTHCQQWTEPWMHTYSNRYKKDWWSCPIPRYVNLDLKPQASTFPALAYNLRSVDFFKPVRSLYRLLSCKSHKKIIILLPTFLISQLIFLRIQNSGLHVKFPRNAREEFLNGNTSPLLLFRINHKHRVFPLISRFSLLTYGCYLFRCPAHNFPFSGNSPNPVRWAFSGYGLAT